MKEEIFENINNPKELEKLYRSNKSKFKSELNELSESIEKTDIIEVWIERLNYQNEIISWGSKNELLYVIIFSLLAGIIAKIPTFIPIEPEHFYPKNVGFIFLPFLILYFSWKNNNSVKLNLIITLALIISVIYVNFFPNDLLKSDSVILSLLHLPLFLWSLLGLSFSGDNINSLSNRVNYLRYNGDLIVLTTIILIAGAILSSITIGLFSIIDINIGKLYSEYVVVFGLSAAPIVSTYLINTNPNLVNKVSPIIANVFTPLIFITLAIYLIAVIVTGKDPYHDREFLLVFNILLILVLAIILFSVVEKSKNDKRDFGVVMLFGLSIVTVIINGIALSAILFRINEWGITPNRIAVLIGNILILINLLIVAYNLFENIFKKTKISKIENSIASYIPIYSIWTIIVVFLFPLIFNFK